MAAERPHRPTRKARPSRLLVPPSRPVLVPCACACGHYAWSRRIDSVNFFIVVRVGELAVYKRVPPQYRKDIGDRILLEEIGPSCVATSYDTLVERDFVSAAPSRQRRYHASTHHQPPSSPRLRRRQPTPPPQSQRLPWNWPLCLGLTSKPSLDRRTLPRCTRRCHGGPLTPSCTPCASPSSAGRCTGTGW